MERILGGDIWWADLNPVRGREQAGVRPIPIISQDVFIALAITSQEPKAGFPLTFELTTAQLPKRSWVKISQIRTLSVGRLQNKISSVSPEELIQIIDGLNEIVGD